MLLGCSLRHVRSIVSSGIVALLAACSDDPSAPSDDATGYDIEIRYLTDAPERLRVAFDRAASRWTSVIVGDVPDAVAELGVSECFPGAPAIRETVDDLLVFVEVAPLFGPHSQTRDCFFRSDGTFPVIAKITVDPDFVAPMFTEGWGDNLVLHQMGHALGMIDFVWEREQLVDFSDSGNPVFIGPATVDAYRDVNAGVPAGSPVPLENVGAAGTVRSHWRQSVFDGELMATQIYPTSALSVVTISALEDLGYAVDRRSADPFVVGAVAAAARAYPAATDVRPSSASRVAR